MEKISDEMANLTRLVQMLAAQFGHDSEIILHDMNKDYRHTIVAIENNWVTGRNVGDGGTNLGLEVLRNPPHTNGDIYNYYNKTSDGRMLRSSTLYFRNDKGVVIGSLCINTDISAMVHLQNTLQHFTMLSTTQQVEEVFPSRVEDLFAFFFKQCSAMLGKSGLEMTMEEKIEAVRFLDGKGFFLIIHSSDEACKFFDISKYTLYKYLGIVRDKNTDKMPETEEQDEDAKEQTAGT